MLEQSLFICYSTPNYSKMTDIFLESLNNINVKNINHKLDTPNMSLEKTGFQSNLWYYCVEQKIQHLINVLSNYDKYKHIKYFIFTDCDIVYIKNNVHEWLNLEKYIEKENKDIFFMRENTTNDVNGGFYIIKNNENIIHIIEFFKKILNIMKKTHNNSMPYGDQSIINNLKKDINYDYIPNDYVIWGTNIYNKNKSLIHHAVCCNNVSDKIKQINIIKYKFI